MDMRLVIPLIPCICVVVFGGPIPVCRKPDLKEAVYEGDEVVHSPGTTLQLTCKEEYEAGTTYVTCLNERWTEPHPPCKLVICPYPGNPGPHMLLIIDCQRYNCKATYDCETGYWYSGLSTITCLRNNTWTKHTRGTCQAVLCPVLHSPSNGKVQHLDRSYSKTATTECNEGFALSDKQAATRRCQGNNTWDGKEVFCEAVTCPLLLEPENGIILQENRSYMAAATTVCDAGYIATNTSAVVRHCQLDNNWDGKAVKCKRRECPKLSMVENGILSNMRGRYEDKVTLQCNSGYTMDGIYTITCQASGKWNADIGRCVKDANILVISLVIIIVVVIGIAIALYCTRNKIIVSCSKPETMPERDPLLKSSACHFTFVIAEDLQPAYSGEAEYNSFISSVKQAIETAVNEFEVLSLDILYLCQSTRRGFISVTFASDVCEKDLVTAIGKSQIEHKGKQVQLKFHLVQDSIQAMDPVKNALSAQILQGKHVKDKSMDKPIDFSTQYVKLKLFSDPTAGIMQREDIEQPDHYQDSLANEKGTEVEDEDLIKKHEKEKYILIRGRAGIGKSTLLQRLLWKWANGEWATQFKAIFLLNLRFLMTISQTMDFQFMLNMCSVYRTGRTDCIVNDKWLEDNEVKIVYVLDGVDEVDFTLFGSKTLETMNKPLQWCFALIKRELQNKSTLIVASRPFARLGEIALKTKGFSCSLQLVQLLGLSRDRVHEFVDKNVKESEREFVWRTMVKNPILMSISSITFYCATLCQLLGEWKDNAEDLTTYSQITVFIIRCFIKRSIQKSESSLKEAKVLQVLAKLAFNGLVRDIGKGYLKLSFHKADVENLSAEKDITNLMLKTGLLMQTEIPDPNDKDGCTVLSQFVHLLIQEFMAMAGLLSQKSAKFSEVLNKLGETQQFSMAALFLYGLAFDTGNDTMKLLSMSKVSEDILKARQAKLVSFAKNMPDKLKAVQIAHESQSSEVACAVGQHHFKDGCCFKNTKLTVIDILAVTFVMKQNPSIYKLGLERAELDLPSITEIGKFLESYKTTGDATLEVELVDDTIGDESIEVLMKSMQQNTSLRALEIASDEITDTGVAYISDAILRNKTLRTLTLSSDNVTDKGIEKLAEALSGNGTLQSLRLMFRNVTDKASHHMVNLLGKNKALKEFWLIEPDMTDAGILSICMAACNNSSIRILRVDCRSITDKVMKLMADSLHQNKSLAKLRLHSSRITDKGVEHLMEGITKKLEEIRLLGFNMEERGIEAVLKTRQCAPNLAIRIWSPRISEPLLGELHIDGRITVVEGMQ